MDNNISITTLQIGGVNSYIVAGKDGAVLIDTGYYANREKLFEKVKDKNIKLIIVTHGHIDHIGGAHYISEKLKVPVAMNDGDLELLKDNSIRNVFADTLIGKLIKNVSVLNFKKAYYDDMKIDISIKDGMAFTFGNLQCRIIELPGHTQGSIGVVVNNNLFAGDAMMNIIKPSKARIYEKLSDALTSQEKILQENICNIYTGHGAMIVKNKLKRSAMR